jgi:hypothetical protein
MRFANRWKVTDLDARLVSSLGGNRLQEIPAQQLCRQKAMKEKH